MSCHNRRTTTTVEGGDVVDEPTQEQLQALYRMCVRVSNLLQSIEMVRYDSRTKHIVMLVEETIQVEIFEDGEVIIE